MNTNVVPFLEAKKIAGEWGYQQLTALQELVFKDCRCGENAREFIIGATSSGKTLIPLVCYRADKRRYAKKEKLLYIVPYRALATQKEKEFQQKFSGEKIVVSTSEYCSEDITVMNGNCDVAIVIYEKVFMFLSNDKSFLHQYTHIVFDELGIVENPERGLKADYILYMACSNSSSNVYVLATPYFDWNKYIATYSFHKHQEISRPVTIRNEILRYAVGETGHECDIQDDMIYELCRKHRALGHKIMIFANSRARVKKLSQKLYRRFADTGKTPDIGEAKRRFLSRLVMTDDDLYGIMERDDYLAYEAGIAYHNASLPEEVRELIENDFMNDNEKLDIVVATETLAYGLNSNVDVVLVAEMDKPKGGGEKKFLTVNEYQNYIGRAGRLGRKKIGYAYTFITDSQQMAWKELEAKIEMPDVIESQYQSLWDRDDCIFHLLNYFDHPDGIELKAVIQNLKTFPCSYGDQIIEADGPVAELRKRGLIRTVADELDDVEKIKVSKTGTRALGFIISIDTYDRLLNAAKWLFENNKIYLFDFLYEVCQCKELQIKDFYTPQDAQIYRKHMLEWIALLAEDGQISSKCMKSVKNNPLIARFRNPNNRFGYKEFTELRRVRMAEALFLWSNCYSVEEIKKRCGFDYGTIKKLGEKAKYITDILSADISMSGETQRLETALKRIGLSLYYGIKRDLIDKLDILELEPVQGRWLRTVGRIKNIKEQNSKGKNQRVKKLIQQIASFPEEYKRLVEGD